MDKCYKKHGYPPGYKLQNRTYGGSVNQVDSFLVNQGEKAAMIVNKGKDKQIVNEEAESSANTMTFTKDQYNQLLALIRFNQQSANAGATSSVNSVVTSLDHTTDSGIFFTPNFFFCGCKAS